MKIDNAMASWFRYCAYLGKFAFLDVVVFQIPTSTAISGSRSVVNPFIFCIRHANLKFVLKLWEL